MGKLRATRRLTVQVAGFAASRGGTYAPQIRYPPHDQGPDLRCGGVADVAESPEAIGASQSFAPRTENQFMAKLRDEMLTIPEVIEEIGVPRATFYRWRQLSPDPPA
ncbi:hypothetical protein ABZT45_44055 [Streptomyces sp. NPDC005356]|uniref:helix-turn-helix transcriptional regulator n=1 Tax=Streptomyces sp. NPDC005356 TaxID=3157167 RepID=UPI0033A9B106